MAYGASTLTTPPTSDDLILADWQVIDLAGAAEHADLCEAALFYLLERLRLTLENPAEAARVKLMVVDEAWRYVRDPAVLAYLAEAAKTWRKKNAALIMATQSAVDVTGTAGAEALLESMPTKLFLANPELPAKAAETFRLNPSEVEIIRGLVSKQELYVRRPNMAATVRLEVDPESYWLYTSSARDSARRAEAVKQHGLRGGARPPRRRSLTTGEGTHDHPPNRRPCLDDLFSSLRSPWRKTRPTLRPTPRPARPSCRYKTRPIRSSTLTPASVTRP